MREILGRFSAFDSENGHRLDQVAVADGGDWDLQWLDMPASQQTIAERAASISDGYSESAPVFCFLGGDNAITRPLLNGLRAGRLAATALLTFDAHHDVRSLDEGPTNGTPVRGLIEDGLDGAHIAQIGIHSFANSSEYRAYCEQQGIHVYTMEMVDRWGIEDVVGSALDELAKVADWIYVDFDIDVLDAAFAPGCPGARPGGMSPRQLARAAFVCGSAAKVGAADFVEVDPSQDPTGITVMNMANVFLAFASGVAGR
jgi:arginase family enzyme